MVPARIRRALVQGLSFDPEHRHRDMRTLLAALTRDPARRWKRVGAFSIPMAALGVGLLAYSRPSTPPHDHCDDLPSYFAGIWDDAKRREIEAAFVATEQPYANDAWATVRDRGDTYVRAWLDAHERACDDQADHTRPRGALAMRMVCLQEQLSRVGAIIEILGQAEATTVLRATETIAQLPWPGDCENIGQLTAQERARENVAAVDRRRLDELLARSGALFSSAAYPKADIVAREALEEARAVGDRWSEAEALHLVALTSEFGDQRQQAESRYHEAFTAALAIGHHACVVDVTLGLVRLTDGKQAVEDAERWARHGHAALQSFGGEPGREAELALALGGVYLSYAKYDDAQEQLTRVIALEEQAGPSGRTLMAAALANLGSLAAQHGRSQEAAESFERAHVKLEEALGDHHPAVATMLINMGGMYGNLGNFERARELYARALEILQTTLGADHPSLSAAHRVLAWALLGLEQPAAALIHAQQGLEIAQASYGDDHGEVARSLSTLSGILIELEREAEAIAAAERALAITRSSFDEAHPSVALHEVELAIVLDRAKRPESAKEHAMAGLALREAAFGSEDGEVGRAALVLAEIELDGLQRPDRALPHAQRALAIIGDADEGNYHRIGEAAFMLAKVWSAMPPPQGPARARELIEQAREAYDAAGAPWITRRDEVDTWARANL
jgi:eukaryotic-like serine/threonine-protein kinase